MKSFDDIKHFEPSGVEFWFARELQEVLGYSQWRRFEDTIKRAKISCEVSGNAIADHFADVGKMVDLGSGSKREVKDYKLSRYACYLVVMNGDPRKEIIALGQTYFAVKTRQQELQDLYNSLTEEDKRLYLRGDIKQKNMLLAEAAKKAGVTTNYDYALFQNAGYRGLYGGLGVKEIASKKGIGDKKDILDYMGSAELGANLFRITLTEEKLKQDQVREKERANETHYQMGKIARDAMKQAGVRMPEDLPAAAKSIKELEKEKLSSLDKTKVIDE